MAPSSPPGPGESYLSGMEDPTTAFPAQRRPIEILKRNTWQTAEEMDYGLYLHQVKATCDLLKVTAQDFEQIRLLPWSGIAENPSTFSSSTDLINPSAASVSYGTDLPDACKTALRMVPAFEYRKVFVILGNTTDLINTPSSRTRETLVHQRHVHTVKLYADDYEKQNDVVLEFVMVELHRIQWADFEMLARAKVAECLELTLAECVTTLDPSVATLYLESFRTPAAIVDWSFVRGSQGVRSGHALSDPSVQWDS